MTVTLNRRTVLGGALIGAAAAGSARAKTAVDGGDRKTRRAMSALEDYVEQHRGDWAIPGMIVSLATRDGLSGQIYSGLADADAQIPVGADHLFHIGSITKMIAALTVWSQIDEGKLSPDQTLAELMPEINVHSSAPITLRHLLNHTSGLPRDASPFLAGGLRSGFAPGSHWSYCNLGYRLLGMITARTDESVFSECAERRVLRPLGMNRSAGAIRTAERARHARGYEPLRIDRPSMRPGPMFAAPWVDYDGAAGCVAATAEDMSRFLRFLIDLADGKGGPVLSDTAARAFLADPADAPGWAEGVTYGNGIAQMDVDGRKFLHHTGGMVSFTSSLHVDREAGVAAFASANVHYATTHRPRNITSYACKLLGAAATEEDAPAPPGTKPVVEAPERFLGTFTAEDGEVIEFSVEDDRLYMSVGGDIGEVQQVAGLGVCDLDGFRETGLAPEMDGDAIKAIWAGSKEYLRDPSKGFLKSVAAVKALEGNYMGDSRGGVPSRVYARGDKLFVTFANYDDMLTQLANGDWISGDADKTSDWARFDGVVDGRPQRVSWTGETQTRRAG